MMHKVSQEAQDSSNRYSKAHIYEGIPDATRQRESALICTPCEAYEKHEEQLLEEDEYLYVEVHRL